MKCKLDGCQGTPKQGRLYCSKECSLKGQVVSRSLIMEQIKEKRRLTNLKKYGVENAGQSAVLREKYIRTNIERYGVSNPLACKSIRDKATNTNIKKYGVGNSQQKKCSTFICK